MGDTADLMETGKTFDGELRLGDEESGLRLDVVVAARLEWSRARVQHAMRDGRITLANGEKARPSERAKAGQVVVVALEPAKVEGGGPTAEALPLRIAHEDDDLLVVDKPAGLVVHPAAGHAAGTLVNALVFHCGQKLAGRGGGDRLGLVHRLDKDTSGLLVVAKTDAAHEDLARQFAERKVHKVYLALACGHFRQLQGSCRGSIGRHPIDRKRMAVRESGRNAWTDYQVIKQWPSAALVKCTLHTGRTHQIRVHLAEMRHPILGDALYGKSKAACWPAGLPPPPRHMLHSAALGFRHPATRRDLTFQSELPDDFASIIAALDVAY